MVTLIAEPESGKRQHRNAFQTLMKQTTEGAVRIASAYVTDTSLLSSAKHPDVRLLTYITRMDIITGASSLDSLTALITSGVRCNYISSGPRLHAKVYLFGDQSAVVTSANLTRRALDNNLEVGVHLSSATVQRLISWFDMLWDRADKLDLETLSKWHQETKVERAEYASRWKKVARKSLPTASRKNTVVDLFKTAGQFFVCNTNRGSLSRDFERSMRDRQYAAAWEKFNYPQHMEKVVQGDAIFMFANGVGIIGVGRAKGPCEKLAPGDPDRLMETHTPEWRVPTDWLSWKDDDGYLCKGQRFTFLDVSGSKYRELRNGVRKHF